MTTYVFSYRIPEGYVPTQESRARWMAWFDSMGDAVVDVGKPVAARASVGTCDSSTELGGYSLISAPDLDAALAIAAGCPALGREGGLEVGELVDVLAEAQAAASAG